MTNEEICVWLKAEAEPKFQKFTSGLIPGTDPIIGVRIPKLRTLAKKIAKEDWRGYLEHAACDTLKSICVTKSATPFTLICDEPSRSKNNGLTCFTISMIFCVSTLMLLLPFYFYNFLFISHNITYFCSFLFIPRNISLSSADIR